MLYELLLVNMQDVAMAASNQGKTMLKHQFPITTCLMQSSCGSSIIYYKESERWIVCCCTCREFLLWSFGQWSLWSQQRQLAAFPCPSSPHRVRAWKSGLRGNSPIQKDFYHNSFKVFTSLHQLNWQKWNNLISPKFGTNLFAKS